MSDSNKLNLFISYSHKDELYREEFVKHIAPLKRNGLIQDWYDRKIPPSSDWRSQIDNNLEDADIICLLVSAHFLDSDECMKEKEISFDLNRKKGASVLPVILCPCAWKDDSQLRKPLALPTDGKAVSKFTDQNDAWLIVYEGLKNLITKELEIKGLQVKDEFTGFLESTDLLSKMHSQKNNVLLKEIFVHPELSKFDALKEYETKITSDKLLEGIYEYNKIVIAGENQSGKTTLCKRLFSRLRANNFVPVYLYDKHYYYHGKIENRIADCYKEQYNDNSPRCEDLEKERIIPIIDDFHFAKRKEKHISDLSAYPYQIVIVDDIYNLNFTDDTLTKSFVHYKIEEFSPVLRDKLIKKWARLTNNAVGLQAGGNALYKDIDEKTELVNATLGKIFGKGIMPAYPFFILSIISTYDTFAKPLDQEITSQGYCYQAFIYMYLRKQGVKNDEIDTYINFLDEFAYLFFSEGKREISRSEFALFMESYLDKYNLPIDQNVLLRNLQRAYLIELDSFNNYFFCYEYLYYFFVAKYLAEHMDENYGVMEHIINNLHKNENAYIAIFMSHHSKNIQLLDELMVNATCLFDQCTPATLTRDEVTFFDEQQNDIVKAVLPSRQETPERERRKRLLAQKKYEANDSDISEEDQAGEHVELIKELRRSIKTVEVIGSIIKNRAGSLDKGNLKSMFEQAMNVHLRILSSFFDLIKTPEEQEEVIEYISKIVSSVIEKTAAERKSQKKPERKLTHEKLEEMSKKIFWNLNFFTIYSIVNKSITSLGSDKLIQIVESVCDDVNTPASSLVKHGILMWYSKNLKVDDIDTDFRKTEFSDIARRIMEFLIVDFCSVHRIGYKDRQRVERKFNIPSERLLECKSS